MEIPDAIVWPDWNWTCVECKREFEFSFDHGEPAIAYKTEHDPLTGLNRIAGEICRECYERPYLPTPQEPTND